jgi:hypothetical protein
MNKFYLIAAFILCFNFSFANSVITASSNGYWKSAATWNLNRLPKVGDTIIIPGGKTVIINDDQNFNGFVYLKVLGVLQFQNNNSTLSVDAPSVIMVYPTGEIIGGGSPSQKIRYAHSIIFDGNDAAIIGPQLASATSGGFVAFADSPLPVKFVGFTVTLTNNNALIQWSTSEEINANMYEVERSEDGSNWTTIAYVAAIGNSSVVNNYSYTDKNVPAKVVYFRIKEVDYDGKTNLTAIKSIKTNTTYTTADIQIASVQNKVLLQFPKEVKGNLVVRFVSLSGQIVDQQTINNPLGQVVLNSKVSGNYVISVSNGLDINSAKQVIL